MKKQGSLFTNVKREFGEFNSETIFAWNFQTPKWEYYFKPFLPNTLIIFETVIAFLIQIAFVIHYARKNNRGVENEKSN